MCIFSCGLKVSVLSNSVRQDLKTVQCLHWPGGTDLFSPLSFGKLKMLIWMHVTIWSQCLDVLRDLKASPAKQTASGSKIIAIMLIPSFGRDSSAAGAASHVSQARSLLVSDQTHLLHWLAGFKLKLCINLPLFFHPVACALAHRHSRTEAICCSNSEVEIPETAFRGQRRIANGTF